MFSFSKSKKKSTDTPVDVVEKASPAKGWLGRLNAGLRRTRNNLTDKLANLILGKKTIDADLLGELEALLLVADTGMEATQEILNNLTQQIQRKQLNNPDALIKHLKDQLLAILTPCVSPLALENSRPFTILVVGVNGAGKTTSIAKLAHYYQSQGRKVMLAAGDTFRAAAIEQLQIWGERNQVPVISQHIGADSASVIYDAMQAAQARQFDLLIADTAGRLHTQGHLMAELQKIKRVMQKINADAPQETMLVLDASMGQNALNQAVQFHEAIGLTSISLTKLDGTAKGGIVFAIAKKLALPVRFIGVGEKIDDLRPFNAEEFIDALFAENKNS